MADKPSFLKNHADTLAIIGVNIAMGSILVALYLSNVSSINAVNSRIDNLYTMFYDLLKEVKK